MHLLHRARQCASGLFQAHMGHIGLTARQYVVLVVVANQDGLSQQEVIDATGIDRSTVSQVVQTLTRKGLVRRKRTREDARTYAISLTSLGRDALKACEPIVRQIDEEIIGVLPPAQASGFLASLSAMANALDASHKK